MAAAQPPRRRTGRAPVPADVLFSRIAKANAAVHGLMALLAFAGFALAGAVPQAGAFVFGLLLAALSAWATAIACARLGGGAAVMAGAYTAKILVLAVVFAGVAQIGDIRAGTSSFAPLDFVAAGLVAGVVASLIVESVLVVRTPVAMDIPERRDEES